MAANTSITIGGLGASSGAVTSVAVATANGFAGTVAGTTTKTITIKSPSAPARRVAYSGASDNLLYSAGMELSTQYVTALHVEGTTAINDIGADVLNIGTGSGATGAVNINTGFIAGAVTIGRTGGTLTTTGTHSHTGVANLTGATTVLGTTLINSTLGADTTIGTSASGQVIARGTAVQMLGTTNTVTGATNINTGVGNTSVTNINTAANGGAVNIGTGASGSTVTIGGINSTFNVRSTTAFDVIAPVTINTSGGRDTSIGNSSSTNTITGTINANITGAGVSNINTGSGSGVVNIGNSTNTTGLNFVTAGTFDRTLYTSTINNFSYLGRTYLKKSAGTVTTGFGVAEVYRADTDDGSDRVMGGTVWEWTDATDATCSTKLSIQLAKNGTSAPRFTFNQDGEFGVAGSTTGVLSVKAAASTTSHTLTYPAVQGAANTALTNDGSGNLSWSLLPLAVNKTSDQVVTNSATLVNDTQLSFPIGISQTRNISMAIKINSVGAGFKCAFTVPSGCTGFLQYDIFDVGGGAEVGSAAIDVTTGFSVTVIGTIDDSATLNIHAYFTNSTTAGTVQFQWAQATALPVVNTTVRKSTLMQVV